MHVIATAGHVDHGKSTLVRALTGMEPDRLEEERRRGLTIELGYAWTTLPGALEPLAFVDVPGHQRFLSTMLAGVGPVPAAMLVVAADGGWEAQTGEHVAALEALGVRHGLVAITRSDLADPEPVRAEVLDRLRGSTLAADGRLEVISVSGRTGAGLPELQAALGRLTRRLPLPQTSGRIRVWIDRAFTIGGAGTVVTGTLGAGTLRIGDELELAGDGGLRTVHVRSLQALGGGEESVAAVARVAVNLRGLNLTDVTRGDVLLTPGADLLSRVVDVESRSGDGSTVDFTALPSELMLHLGAAAVPVHLRAFSPDFARLTLDRELPLRRGDRALLRDPGRHSVAAGVVLADIDPPGLNRRGAAGERASELAAGPDPLGEVARRGAADRRRLHLLGILDPGKGLPAGLREVAGIVITDADWERWTARLREVVDAAAKADPLGKGMAPAAAAEAARIPAPQLIQPLALAAGLRWSDGRVQTAAVSQFPPGIQAALDRLGARLRADPFDAPDANELAADGLTVAILATAVRLGLLLRLSGTTGPVVLLPDAPEEAVKRLAQLPSPFTVSDARQALATSRRIAVPLLEHLDSIRRTKRVDASGRVLV